MCYVKTWLPAPTLREWGDTCCEPHKTIAPVVRHLITPMSMAGLAVYLSRDNANTFPKCRIQLSGKRGWRPFSPGSPPSTRSKYVSRWRRWESFTHERGLEPWVVRTSPDWDDVMFDLILFETRVTGGSVDVAQGKISGIRFWNLLIWFPDFAI